jgi:RNA polymerase sigma-70 factor (ECF subfamily)
MTRAEEFQELRPLLFSIAYRILGSVAEAEDAVQESWLRFAATSTQPASVKAFLSAVVTRLSIDVLRSARVRREEYVGPWFPEPLLTDPYQDPERSAELADSVSTAALLLLERLSPLERAAFVLRDVFGFEFAEIASAVGRSEAACRQLVVRARRHMEEGRPRFPASRAEQDELAERFFGALREGDIAGLRELLAADVQLVGDGGGKVPQLARAIAGADKVARVFGAVFPPLAQVGVAWEVREINGQAGAILRDRDGGVLLTLTLDVLDGQIQMIRSVSNPDKLRHVGPVADTWAVAREAKQAQRGPQAPPAGLGCLVDRPARAGTADLTERAAGQVAAPRDHGGDLEDQLRVAFDKLGAAIDAQEARDPRVGRDQVVDDERDLVVACLDVAGPAGVIGIEAANVEMRAVKLEPDRDDIGLPVRGAGRDPDERLGLYVGDFFFSEGHDALRSDSVGPPGGAAGCPVVYYINYTCRVI